MAKLCGCSVVQSPEPTIWEGSLEAVEQKLMGRGRTLERTAYHTPGTW